MLGKLLKVFSGDFELKNLSNSDNEVPLKTKKRKSEKKQKKQKHSVKKTVSVYVMEVSYQKKLTASTEPDPIQSFTNVGNDMEQEEQQYPESEEDEEDTDVPMEQSTPTQIMVFFLSWIHETNCH